jgi:hypothetical protein
LIGLSGIFTHKERSINPSSDEHLLTRYNYDEFVAEKFEPWLNFPSRPPLGYPGPDYPLWHLKGRKTTLSEVWSQHTFTIVEFGSFT